jgi:hypothetical protein
MRVILAAVLMSQIARGVQIVLGTVANIQTSIAGGR